MDDNLKKQIAITNHNMEKAMLEILKSTCHFFVKLKDREKIFANGSGIFFKVNDKYFIITAAHVTDDANYDLAIPYKNLIVKFPMNIISTVPFSGKRQDDKIDISIIQFTQKHGELFDKEYRFLSLSDIELNHTINPDNWYFAVGWPQSRTNFNPIEVKVKPKPFAYASKSAIFEKYNLLKFSPTTHILIDFKKKDVDIESNAKITLPKPYGMSGGGLWYMPNFFTVKNSDPKKKLVGILIEYHANNYNVIVATKLDQIINAIENYF